MTYAEATEKMNTHKGRDVQYHRPPTAGEIKFGYGTTHYRTFPFEQCVHKGTRVLKKWFVADNGLRYYC